MFSTDDGQTWQSLQLNLPTVAVHDLVVKDDDLVLATHGRSLWILDDLEPVREFDNRDRGARRCTSSPSPMPCGGGWDPATTARGSAASRTRRSARRSTTT